MDIISTYKQRNGNNLQDENMVLPVAHEHEDNVDVSTENVLASPECYSQQSETCRFVPMSKIDTATNAVSSSSMALITTVNCKLTRMNEQNVMELNRRKKLAKILQEAYN